jgi:splicing factor 3B subunit 3
VPAALAAYQGYVMAGIGRALRLYDMGKKRLLRKAENKVCRRTKSSLPTH